VRRYHAGLAIGCYNDAPCDSCLAILLYGERHRVIINLCVRPHIGLWITCDGIVFTVKLTGPLIMRRLTVLVGAIDDNFHLVASGLIRNGTVLSGLRGKLRFRLIQLPGPHLRVVGEARCPREKAKRHSQSNSFRFHASIEHGFSIFVNVSFNLTPGKRVRISGYELWKIDKDGLIAESKGHFDSAEHERQLKHGVDV
jgi:hypothetical protein